MVDAPVEHAFRVFTERLGEWWPVKTHSVAQENAETVVLERREGGRFYERTRDGNEHLWGTVTDASGKATAAARPWDGPAP